MTEADCPPDVVWCYRASKDVSCRLPTYSPEQCQASGGTQVSDPGDGSLHAAGCPEDRDTLGLVDGAPGCLCCRICPGGDWEPMPEPWQCPVGANWCKRWSPELSCWPRTVHSLAECRAEGGEPVGLLTADTRCGGNELPFATVEDAPYGVTSVCCRIAPWLDGTVSADYDPALQGPPTIEGCAAEYFPECDWQYTSPDYWLGDCTIWLPDNLVNRTFQMEQVLIDCIPVTQSADDADGSWYVEPGFVTPNGARTGNLTLTGPICDRMRQQKTARVDYLQCPLTMPAG